MHLEKDLYSRKYFFYGKYFGIILLLLFTLLSDTLVRPGLPLDPTNDCL